ncbi:hypothetical protein [Vibrio campbellii]|uniref:hypothetical protein n=1 Tax=Vibrio campbellii TaxID=680 RepID=UPI000AEBA5F0|nr:hypothetical protein [Vibrio campbellii]
MTFKQGYEIEYDSAASTRSQAQLNLPTAWHWKEEPPEVGCADDHFAFLFG